MRMAPQRVVNRQRLAIIARHLAETELAEAQEAAMAAQLREQNMRGYR
jgi:hypothetical protein